jgi:hypothetical protein
MDSSFREKGSYYDVPQDVMSLEMSAKNLSNDKYNPKLYMDKQKQFSREDVATEKKQHLKDSRYV